MAIALAIDYSIAALPARLYSYYKVSNANTLCYSTIPYSVFYSLPVRRSGK